MSREGRRQIPLGPDYAESSTNANTTTVNESAMNNTDEYAMRNLIKRASSQGAQPAPSQQASASSHQRSSRDGNAPSGKESHDFGVSSIGQPVSQSGVFTEFKVRSPDNFPAGNQTLPEIRQSQSATKKQRDKQPDVISPANNSTCGIPPLSGKPPMSSKSKYSSVKDSIKAGHSIKSPTGSEKGGAGLRVPSPRPQALAPIANPPQLPANTSAQVLPHDPSQDSIQNTATYTEPERSTDGTAAPATTSVDEPGSKQTDSEDVKYEEIKIKWTPLLDKGEKVAARDYGHSFGAKKVAMGPGFMNLRFMCHCLARAI